MVFFQDSSGYVHHVGMYIGDDKFLHAPHTGDVVKISSLDEPYYAHQFAGGRRMDTSAPGRRGAPCSPRPSHRSSGRGRGSPPSRRRRRPGRAAAADPRRSGRGGTCGAVRAARAASPRWTRGEGRGAALDGAGDQGRRGAGAEAARGRARGGAHAPPPPRRSIRTRLAGASAGGYPGDAAQPEQYAQWMAAAAQKAGLPPQLPIMAALTESGLHNLSGGDRDSMGFFQMRTSVWDQGEYAGYGQNPDLQLKWFITQALAIKEQRLARGETAFQSDPSQWGNWIADVERPQEDLRGRYQTHLDAANQLLGIQS